MNPIHAGVIQLQRIPRPGQCFIRSVSVASIVAFGGLLTAADDDNSHLNNVTSTSPDTPGFARLLPIDEVVAVRGIVLGPDGSPVEGAEVWAAALFVDPPHRERTHTDTDGGYVLHLKPLTGNSARWNVRAFHENLGGDANDRYGTVELRPGQQPPVVEIRLSERSIVHGRILTEESDQPIPDARLYLGDGRIVVSDDEGRYRIPGLRQTNHECYVVAAGRVRHRVHFHNIGQGDSSLDIHLPVGGRLVGSVRDADTHEPVTAAWIKWPVSGNALALSARCALVGADGTFVFDGVPLNALQWNFHATAPGYHDHDVEHLVISLDEEARLEHDFVIRRREPRTDATESPAGTSRIQPIRLPRRDLSGRVVNNAGQPVAGASVKWGATMYEDTRRETTSDEDGSFRLVDVPDAEGFVTVIAEGFAPQFTSVLLGQLETDVTLSTGVSAGGRVVGSSGQPLARVQVVPVIPSPDPDLANPYWLSSRQTLTDEDGRFELEHLPAGAISFDFLRADLSELRGQTLDLSGTDNIVRIASGGGITGRVEGPDGEPIRDFRVLVDIPWDYESGDPVGGFSASYGSSGISFTHDDGRFVLGDMNAANIYRITLTSPGYGNAVLDRIQAHRLDQPPPDDEIPVFRLTRPHELIVEVKVAGTESRLTGARVGLIYDRPAQDEQFRWNWDDLGQRFQTTGDDGIVRWRELSFDEGTLYVRCPGFARQRIGWRDRARNILLELKPESVISGTVRIGEQPVAKLYGALRNESGDSFTASVTPADQGRFRFGELPAGEYTLTFNSDRAEVASRQISLDAGEHTTIDIQLEDE